MADYIIAGGLIVDGTGQEGFPGDVLIEDGRIAGLGPGLAQGAEGRLIEAAGLVVTPGFIDAHSHSDCSLLKNPRAQSALCQGVTSEIIGNCGLSCFPVEPAGAGELADYLLGLGLESAQDLAWADLEAYAARLERDGLGVNLAPLVGHGSIRIAVMGYDAREATTDELEAMDRLLARALDQGAWGLSTGLVYPPGINAPSGEIEFLLERVARAGALHATHLRGDTVRAAPGLVDSLKEALTGAQRTGVRLHVSHLPPKFPNQGSVEEIIRLLEESGGVTCDGHPFMAAMTDLAAHLPPWIFEGGAAEAAERLADPTQRAKVKNALDDTFGHLDQELFWGLNQPILPDPESRYQDKRLGEIALDMGTSPAEAVMDLLAGQGAELFKVVNLLWIYSPEETRRLLLWPGAAVGADGVSTSPGQTGGGMETHPRSWAAFTFMLTEYWRDKGLIGLEDLIHKMTGLPAEIFGLEHRGTLAPGQAADVAVFHPEELSVEADYGRPALSRGMRLVMVNGAPVLEQGRPTGRLPGRVLRRGE